MNYGRYVGAIDRIVQASLIKASFTETVASVTWALGRNNATVSRRGVIVTVELICNGFLTGGPAIERIDELTVQRLGERITSFLTHGVSR